VAAIATDVHESVRSDAWRCGPTQGFYDPCFSNGGSATPRYVVCPAAPWSKRVVLVRLSKPLPWLSGNPTKDPLDSSPWGIVTATRKRCQLIATGTSLIAGMRISYYCARGGYLVGEPRRATQTWRIVYLADVRSNRLAEVSISSAWW
jgi:hypothetical protein